MADIVYRVKETLDGYVPSNELKTIKPGVAYYVGMPLAGGADGMLEPTDKDPEYICMADFKPDDEVPRLDVPCMKVGPQIIFKRIDGDGETITQISGGGGGGDSKLIVTATSTTGGGGASGYVYYSNVTLDKTVEEIDQANAEGKQIVLMLKGIRLLPIGGCRLFVGFGINVNDRSDMMDNKIYIYRVYISYNDGNIVAEGWPLTTKP